MIFRHRIRLIAPVLIATAGVACGLTDRTGGGAGHAVQPAELVEFEATVEVERRWKRKVGAGTDRHFLKLRPAHSGGRVYAAGPGGNVAAYDARSGNRIWETATRAPISGGPGVGDGLVTLGTLDADVIALDAQQGTPLWRKRVSSEVLAPPLAARGVVVVRTGDGKLVGLKGDDGTRIWVYDRTVPVLTLRGTSAPVLFEDTAIAGFDDGTVVALSLADGQIRWESRVAAPKGRFEFERIVDIDADPLLAEDTVYVVTFQGQSAALDARSGSVLWRRDMSSYSGMGMDSSGTLYISDEMGHVWAVDRSNGASLWRQQRLQGRGLSPPVWVGDYVVTVDSEGYVHWLRREDGHFAARIRTGREVLSPPVAGGDLVYVYDRSGTLSAVGPR